MSDFNEDLSIDIGDENEDKLERLKSITKMFSEQTKENDEYLELQNVEKFSPSEKIKDTFQKFEELGSSNGANQIENEIPVVNGSVRSVRRTTKEYIPYHEMAEVKDKFEKGLLETNKPRIEKRLDVRVQSGTASSKKQAIEQGEFEQQAQSNIQKTTIETEIIAGLASSKRQAFEQQQIENGHNSINNKDLMIERDALAGVATEKKAQFESGQIFDRPITQGCSNELATILGTGLAQTKRSELLSKIDAEQQTTRASERIIDIDTEQGIAIARREQLASLANSEFKPAEKHIDVVAGLASTIKEQYIADAKKNLTKSINEVVDIETGLTKNLATAFEKLDETMVKRTIDLENELVECAVAKERVAMFKNLENGTQSPAITHSPDAKIRVDRVEYSDTLITMSVRLQLKSNGTDNSIISTISNKENGNVIRESDKRVEVYFEKGQTKQLVEQWKTKQGTPESDTVDVQATRESEIVEQGKAKNLRQMWQTIDKENTSPSERRGVRAMTPPIDNERRLSMPQDEELNDQRAIINDDKSNIESGYARAVRERLLQTAEQQNTINKRKALKQFTPPPELPNDHRRKSVTPPNDGIAKIEQPTNEDEFLPNKGQAQSLKSRFIELEQDALKVETSASKIKYVPKRFVNTPAPKQRNFDSSANATLCSACNKTVYAMEKIEADKKIYHKLCFKCTHCKSTLKLGNYTANDGQIYCKPHFLQLFALKGNYSAGFGLTDHKTRWSASLSSNHISN